jgi:hypothetical protein
MSNVPRFQDPFLEDLAFAFRKRRKALAHKTRLAEHAKVYELVDGEKMERLEIELVEYEKITLRLHAWPDRLIWLDARRSAKRGWAWVWHYDGRLLGRSSPSKVIEALEVSRALLHDMNASRTQFLAEPWARLIARGPRPVG